MHENCDSLQFHDVRLTLLLDSVRTLAKITYFSYIEEDISIEENQ